MGLFDEIFTDTSDTSDTSIRDCARYKKYFFEKGKKENSEYHESRGEVSEVSEMSETSNPIFPSETSPVDLSSRHQDENLLESLTWSSPLFRVIRIPSGSVGFREKPGGGP